MTKLESQKIITEATKDTKIGSKRAGDNKKSNTWDKRGQRNRRRKIQER